MAELGQGHVSTHSRLKAAGQQLGNHALPVVRFNTQPPEGGWHRTGRGATEHFRFNTQPPEGGWNMLKCKKSLNARFNTQPPEGG